MRLPTSNPDLYVLVYLKQCVIIKNEFNYESIISFSHFFMLLFILLLAAKEILKKSDGGTVGITLKKRIQIIFHVFMHRILLWFLLYPCSLAIMWFLCINMENIFFLILERLKKLKVLNSFFPNGWVPQWNSVCVCMRSQSWQIKLRGNNIKYVMDEHEQDKK